MLLNNFVDGVFRLVLCCHMLDQLQEVYGKERARWMPAFQLVPFIIVKSQSHFVNTVQVTLFTSKL